jgi:aminopeptidase
MTQADSVDIDFEVDQQRQHLHIELGCQEAQKSHGICRQGPDVVNLPAGEVYFVPLDAAGSFPIKFDDGTLALMQVEKGRVTQVSLLRGNEKTIKEVQAKFRFDPASAILGELGFGTQLLPHSGGDIQDEKIFGTFHLATGRNDHLKGAVTLDRFTNPRNATHDDILFSPVKTKEIRILQVRLNRHGQTEILIENSEPASYLWNNLLSNREISQQK